MYRTNNRILFISVLLAWAKAFTLNNSSSTFRKNAITSHTTSTKWIRSNLKQSKSELNMSIDKEVANEVQALLAKAKAIRESLPEEKKPEVGEMKVDGAATSVADEIDDAVGYRLYIDIGREDGTWMDPKWGASGKRIETSIDVSFLLPQSDINMDDTSLAGENVVSQMVKDNLSGKSSAVRILNTLTGARLRGGFDQMNCNGGGYRIDAGNGGRSSSSTARFFIEVDGTEGEKSNGDIFIPKAVSTFHCRALVIV